MFVRNLVKNFQPSHALKLYIGIALLFAILGFFRAESGSNDFDTYHFAGKSLLEGQGIYREDVTHISPFLYSPITACFFALWAWLPLGLSASLWILFNAALYLFCFLLLCRIFSLDKHELVESLSLPRMASALLLVIFGTIFLLDNLSMAQVNIFILTLCITSIYNNLKNRHWWAGLLLSGAIMIKMSPLLIMLYFLARRSWKSLAACMVGLILLTAVIPLLFLGSTRSLNEHRQWYGRIIKPSFIGIISKIKKEDPHHLRKSVAAHKSDILKTRLNRKNQSLDAMLTRWLLKDRNQYIQDPDYPIYAIKKYEKLPVLFGGLSNKKLGRVLRVIQASLLLALIAVWLARSRDGQTQVAFSLSLLFLTLTMLSPWARSHQFVMWTIPLFTLHWMSLRKNVVAKTLQKFAWVALAFFCLQVLPYGKAMGFGALANFSLWLGFMWAYISELKIDKLSRVGHAKA